MVTHVSPTPSVSSSGASTAYRYPSSSSRSVPALSRRPARRESTDTLQPPTTFPPSPPLSYASPPSSYVARSSQDEPRRSSRAGSVSSRASTSAAREPRDRHRSSQRSSHRSARSECTPSQADERQNAFPWFSQSGNVEITLRDRSGRRSTVRYLLHSLILSQNSRVFAQELKEPNGEGSGQRAARAEYELDWSDAAATAKGGMPFLAQTSSTHGPAPPPRPQNKPPTSSTSFFRNLSSTLSGHSRSSSSSTAGVDSDILTAYDNLFLIFYNHTPRLDSRDLATAYVQCKLLLTLGSHYSALPVVAPRVDHHLLRFHRQLWPQVARYPTSYLKLAHLARSRTIFAEALVHVVGQWPTAAGYLSRGAVDDALLDLIEDKVEELEEAKARIDLKLFRLSLTTSRGERVAPSSSMSDWLAVSLFRHWLAENTTPTPQGILKDSTTPSSSRRTSRHDVANSAGRAYRSLAASGQAYLARDELKAFWKLQSAGSYSRDGHKRFEKRVEELKHQAKDIVKPLTRSFLELDADPRHQGADLPYLTCTRMEDRDFDYIWGES